MARFGFSNPFAFTPLPVTIICTLVYLAVAISVLVVHFEVPPAPETPAYDGINLTEAWHDLQFLSNGFHPYNSHRNDVVRDWILQRLSELLVGNGASTMHSAQVRRWSSASAGEVIVFDDMTSNLSFSASSGSGPGIGTYYEGNNIIVYVRGSEDEKGDWWSKRRFSGGKGVLINAHYDSVPTGYGATDDGVGVVSILQVIKHFSSAGNQPKHGIVALFNNGEENYLNGARAFGQHPTSRFPATFLNLEGAGAGGRATLFRSTDTEVTRKYKGTEHPFGTVISGDGFKAGFIRSQTDYIVFNEDLDMRGLDIAFFEPRSRYHTAQDDARHTSTDSLWHMLSAALHTMHGLTDSDFSKAKGSEAVWFDVFGKAFAVFELHTIFAVSVTLLVVSPLVLIAAFSFLSKADKLYPFSTVATTAGKKIRLKGLRGFFRFPFLVVSPTALVIALALLIAKVNPFVAYSSPYALWSMMLSAWLFAAWFLSRTADFLRPSAFHRLYTCLWLFVVFWALLVIVTILEDDMGIASGYYVVWYFLAVSLATAVSVFELFALEKKSKFVEKQLENPPEVLHDDDAPNKRTRPATGSRPQSSTALAGEEEPTETTSLLSGHQRSSFANYSFTTADDASQGDAGDQPKPYEYEQEWSTSLPSWTWIIQLILLVPFNLILIGPVGLQIVTATDQTIADGNAILPVYLLIATFSTLLLVPLVPFLHRFTYHIPVFCFFVFVGTLIYNSVAFPFSTTNPFKFYFIQRVDLDTGINRVGLNGVGKSFLTDIIQSLPSSAGQSLKQTDSTRQDQIEYSWYGLPPVVVPIVDPHIPPQMGYRDWLSFNASRVGPNEALISVAGRNTRSCQLRFDRPVTEAKVDGSAYDERFPTRIDGGIRQIRLWSREWEKTWIVTVTWPEKEENGTESQGLDGQVVCLWNDEQDGRIPALDEARRYAPPWAILASLSDGLVEGHKTFLV